MKITTTPIFTHKGQPMMVLKRYELDTSKLPLAAARAELTQKIHQNDNASATWGYFPEVSDDFPYTASKELAESARANILNKDTQVADYPVDLAFVRLATSEPQSAFGGFHVDVSPGIAHQWTEGVNKDANILRILFNVYHWPRKLEFYPHAAEDLRSQGHDIPHDRYKILEFPDSLTVQSVDIPPMEEGAVYALQFLSNHVPHAGRTYAEGHFLVSFGGYIEAGLRFL